MENLHTNTERETPIMNEKISPIKKAPENADDTLIDAPMGDPNSAPIELPSNNKYSTPRYKETSANKDELRDTRYSLATREYSCRLSFLGIDLFIHLIDLSLYLKI